jgi:hypothetical protein
MANADVLHEAWLVAAWPGMGNVAVGAGAYLIEQLGARLVHEVEPRDLFDVQQIEVKEGLAKPARIPRSLFFEWRDPQKRRDLLIFIGEAQPQVGGYAFCHRLLDYATSRGVKRVFTFAAMATQIHPSTEPRVFGVATERTALAELRRQTVELLGEGQISGLNGVLLAAGAARGLSGVCLLGELPFFAVGVPNPRASQAALEVFATMAQVTIDFAAIARQAEAVERGLIQLLEKMKRGGEGEGEGEEFPATEPEPGDEEKREPAAPDPKTRRRIEQLFDEATRDRSQALKLKEELDRLGLFQRYENRFLDLFKKAD